MASPLTRAEEKLVEPEITLSTPSLLGIFLGLVLVCGVFFGFGYSIGRRSGSGTTGAGTTAADAGAPRDNAGELSGRGLEQLSAPKQVANSVNLEPALSAQPDNTLDRKPVSSRLPQPRSNATPVALNLPSPKTPQADSVVARKRESPAKQPPAAGSAAGPMVQVAAVVHQEDADALVSALRQRGFSAVVRTEPGDAFLHVQVGPFPDHDQATQMRQKLVSDGYNAFIRQQ